MPMSPEELRARIDRLSEAFSASSRRADARIEGLHRSLDKALGSNNLREAEAIVGDIFKEMAKDSSAIHRMPPSPAKDELLRKMHACLQGIAQIDAEQVKQQLGQVATELEKVEGHLRNPALAAQHGPQLEQQKAELLKQKQQLEASLALDKAMKSKGLEDFNRVKSDEIKKQALTNLFFAHVNNEHFRKIMQENVARELLKAKREQAARPMPSTFDGYTNLMSQASDTMRMHAMYDPQSFIGLAIYELLEATVATAVALAVPSKADAIAQFMSPNGAAPAGGAPVMSGGMVPDPADPTRMIPDPRLRQGQPRMVPIPR